MARLSATILVVGVGNKGDTPLPRSPLRAKEVANDGVRIVMIENPDAFLAEDISGELTIKLSFLENSSFAL